MKRSLNEYFSDELLIGWISMVKQDALMMNVYDVSRLSFKNHFGEPLHGGSINSYVVIRGFDRGYVGQISEIMFLEKDRADVNLEVFQNKEEEWFSSKSFGELTKNDLNPKIYVNLLFAFDYITWKVEKISAIFPSVGSEVYLLRSDLLKMLYSNLFDKAGKDIEKKSKCFATLLDNKQVDININMKNLLNRHCAIVGKTGSGKSWTAMTILEELIDNKDKVIILDPTGEYSSWLEKNKGSIGKNVNICKLGVDTKIEYSKLSIEDFYLIFNPAPNVQRPILKNAIYDLKLAAIYECASNENKDPNVKIFYNQGVIEKTGKEKNIYEQILKKYSDELKKDSITFGIENLGRQIENECIYKSQKGGHNVFGDRDDKLFSDVSTLITRVEEIVSSPDFKRVFGTNNKDNKRHELMEKIDLIYTDSGFNSLVVDLSDVINEYGLKENIIEIIGRRILKNAKDDSKRNKFDVFVFLDEAHNFFNASYNMDWQRYRLNTFEILVKEARKFRTFLCIITQRPREISETMLSQFGTFIVHNLSHPADIDVVKRALETYDERKIKLLPNLAEGEAFISSVNFPNVMLVKIKPPVNKPN